MTVRLLICSMLATSLFAAPESRAGLPEKMPADTLVYIGWPGSAGIKEQFEDTALARIMNEPEMQPLREKLLPAIDALISTQVDDEQGEQVYARAKVLLEAIYTHPTAIALINVDATTLIPMVDAGVIVQSGDRSAQLARELEAIFEAAGMPMQMIRTARVGQWEMQELPIMGPGMSLRWGVIEDSLVVSFGNRLLKHLVPEYLARERIAVQPPADEDSDDAPEQASPGQAAPVQSAAANLAETVLFREALKTTGGSPNSPMMFMNLERSLLTVEAFQPMLSAFSLPILGEQGGVRKVLAEIGVPDPRALTITWTARAGGLQSNMFLHAPGMQLRHEPLTEADLKIIPAGASWASAGQMHLRRTYDIILRVVQAISPDTHDELMEVIAKAEARMGMKIGEDVLESFGDTWIFFDEPQNGSLLFTGITLVADVTAGQRVEQALRVLVDILAEETDSVDQITLREEDYKGVRITYMNFSGLPIPFAPAWAVHDGRWILALYPQMVRITLERMSDPQARSIADNPDFQRAWKLMPPNASSMSYVDAVRGVRQLYSIGLPVAQALIAFGQGQGLDMDVTSLPSLPSITRHVFASVSAGVTTPDGYLVQSHGAVPAALASLGQTSFAVPLAVSVALPALSNAREQAKRAVSMANLKGIGTACILYAVDHKEDLPPDLQVLLDSGAISRQMLISPLDDDPGEDGSYIYVGAGLNARAVGPFNPSEVPVAYEKPENYGGYMTAVLFLDGHVEQITTQRLDELLEATRELMPEAEEEQDVSRDLDAKAQAEEAEEEQLPAVTRTRRPGSDSDSADLGTRIARAMVSRAGPVSMAIDVFRLDVGRYPKRLSELTEAPAAENDRARWNGPYIRSADDLKDPWGHPLKYLSPGEVNENSYDLWSVGPDGRNGTSDDVAGE